MKLPNVSSRFGAQMGRMSIFPENRKTTGKLKYRTLKWVDRDYDENGAYWGNNGRDSIYFFFGDLEGEEFTTQIFIRATSIQDAKDRVLEILPEVTFGS